MEMLLGVAPEAETSQQIHIHQCLLELDAALDQIRNAMDQIIDLFIEDWITPCEGVFYVTDALNIKVVTIMNEIHFDVRGDVRIRKGTSGSKLQVPEPKHFEGVYNLNVLENFLWGIEE